MVCCEERCALVFCYEDPVIKKKHFDSNGENDDQNTLFCRVQQTTKTTGGLVTHLRKIF